MQRTLKISLLIFAALLIASLAVAAPFLYHAATLPVLKAEDAQASIANEIVVTARFTRLLNVGTFGKQRLQSYLWRDGQWQPLQILATDDHGQARLRLAAGTFSQAGRYLIGWKWLDETPGAQTIKVSTIIVN